MAVIGAIRKRVGLLILIIALAIIAFLLMDVFNSQFGMGQSSVAAGSVNGTSVDYTQYEKRVQNALDNEQRNNPNLSDADRLRVRDNAWNQYISSLVSEQEYKKLGLNVSESELSSLFTGDNPDPELMTFPSFRNQETGTFDPAMVRQFVTMIGSDTPPEGVQASQIEAQRGWWNQVLTYFRSKRANSKYTNLISKAYITPTFMAEMNNSASNKKVDLQYTLIPYTTVPDAEVNVTDADLKSYLNANRGVYEAKSQAGTDIEYVVFDVKPTEEDKAAIQDNLAKVAPQFKSTPNDSLFINNNSSTPYTGSYYFAGDFPPGINNEAQIMAAPVGQVVGPYLEGNAYKMFKVIDKTYVADSVNVSHILVRSNPAKADSIAAVVASLKDQVLSGANFATLARNNSADTKAADNGGNLGWVKLASPTGPAAFPAFRNAVFYRGRQGDVLTAQTPQGFHIIKINQSNPTKEAVKVGIISRDIYPSDVTVGNTYSLANNFASENRSLSSFKAAAEAGGYEIKEAPNVAYNAYTVLGLGATDELPSWAYSSDVGDVSPVIDVDGRYVVATVVRKFEEGKPTVDAFRNELQAAVMNEKKAANIVSQLGSNIDPNAAASQFGQSSQTATGIAFQGTNAALSNEPKVVATAVAMDASSAPKTIAGNRGLYVLKVTNVTEPSSGDTSIAKQAANLSTRSQLSASALNALREAADVDDSRYSLKGY